MDYQETLAYIHQTPKFSRILGNAMLKKLLAHLGNPQDTLDFIHVAGTNGKGSVSIMLAEILKNAGLKVGLFTSPYLERFNERIQINRTPIADEALAAIVTTIRDCIESHNAPVSEFALDTAAAFCYFAQQKCDIVVLETGLGGRLDATNVIAAKRAAVLTAIGMDHMQYLGDTIEKITLEKCGIIHPNTPVISAPSQEESVRSIVFSYAKAHHAPVYIAEEPQATEQGILYRGQCFSLGMQGAFQAYNAATALETVRILRGQGFSIPDAATKKGLLEAKNAARFECFSDFIILDGGHNAPAASALFSSLAALKKQIYFCIAMMEDKDCRSFLEILSPLAAGAVFTQIDMPRCCDCQKLSAVFQEKSIPAVTESNPETAVQKAVTLAKEADALLCICGSLYFAGQVRPYLKKWDEK